MADTWGTGGKAGRALLLGSKRQPFEDQPDRRGVEKSVQTHSWHTRVLPDLRFFALEDKYALLRTHTR